MIDIIINDVKAVLNLSSASPELLTLDQNLQL
ncbi:hypothetical protein DSM00_376 [Leeuwenhoekiella aequorea]|uniref:Uncharacterized protein n=1 Tax=Leeuwenhoekiella aequorea TaxID=283736 RepID=A0A4Q0PDS4_9FLAO|nr:hypothetical protein DSM00_376 [Leeuwenhoekiella aequorea]